MISRCISKSRLGTLVCLAMLGLPGQAAAQYNQWFSVDCSHIDTDAYPSINAVIPVLTAGSFVRIKPGTCEEWVNLSNLTNVAFVVDSTDQSAMVTIVGRLNIQSSRSLYLQGLNSRPRSGAGIVVNDSSDITFDSCSSSHNNGPGMSIGGASSVTIQNTGSFSYNGQRGISVGGNSTLQLLAWGDPIDISGNIGAGLYVDRSVVYDNGNVTITNNQGAPQNGLPGGFGIDARGGAKGGVFGIYGPNTIANNQGGGVSLMETSEMSLGGNISWAQYPLTIQGNGPVGISAEFGSQVTLFGGTQIVDNSAAGVDLYGNSQAAIFGINQITHNGYGAEPGRAGVRVDGGSQAYIRDASITQSGGPGILVQANSGVDIAGSSVNSNAGGAVVCDASGTLTTDLTSGILGSSNSCKVQTSSGVKRNVPDGFSQPNFARQKALADQVHAIILSFHR